MKHLAAITCLLLLGIAASAQPIERHIADSLSAALTKARTDPQRIAILNRLAQFYIFKPGELQTDFDSATRCLTDASRINGTVRSASLAGQLLLTESYMLREKGRRDSAITTLEEAISILEPTGDNYHLGKALFELSGYYSYDQEGELRKKLALVEQATVAFGETTAYKEQGDALMMLGDLFANAGNPDRATETLNRALNAYHAINYPALQGVYILLGRIAYVKNDNKQAFYYKLLALKTAQTCHDTTMQLCQINMQVALEYAFSGKYEISLNYFKAALSTALKYNDRIAIALIAYNISRTYTLLDRSDETLVFLSTLPPDLVHSTEPQEKALYSLSYVDGYLAAGQYEKARQYCNALLSMANKKMVPPDVENAINHEAASYYFAVHELQKARYYLLRNAMAKTPGSGRARAADEKIGYMVDSAQGNYQGAFNHLRAYNSISDSLFGVIKSHQFQQLEVEYETAKKTDSLKAKDQLIGLLTQRNSLQQTTLKQETLIKNSSIAGAAIILIFFVLLYYQYRINQKSNRIILQKNKELADMLAEKEWWLREVHHRVKNNLHTIICLLESQAVYLEKDALTAVENSQHRIYAMSLIHQKLYQNDDLQVIDMSIYLEEFVGYLKDSFDAQKIEFILKLDPVRLNLQQAIPVALIINEAVTNSIKYAFGNESNPNIRLSMTEKEGLVKLIIMDNGRGFDLTAAVEGKSLGMQLIKGLGKELKGTVRIESKGGTQLTFEFKKGPLIDQTAFVNRDSTEQ